MGRLPWGKAKKLSKDYLGKCAGPPTIGPRFQGDFREISGRFGAPIGAAIWAGPTARRMQQWAEVKRSEAKCITL